MTPERKPTEEELDLAVDTVLAASRPLGVGLPFQIKPKKEDLEQLLGDGQGGATTKPKVNVIFKEVVDLRAKSTKKQQKQQKRKKRTKPHKRK